MGLDPLTLVDLRPPDFVDIAADAGFSEVGFFVTSQSSAISILELGTALFDETLERLAARKLRVGTVTSFDLKSGSGVATWGAPLRAATALGARTINVAILSDIDEELAVLKFRELCRDAGERGLIVSLEFLAFSPVVRSLGDALRILEKTNATNARLTVDCLHLIRTGGSAAQLARVDPTLIGHVQICDGLLELSPDLWLAEAGEHRLYAGEGEIPLVEIMRLVPPHLVVAAEIPRRRDRERGATPAMIARECWESSQRIFCAGNRSPLRSDYEASA